MTYWYILLPFILGMHKAPQASSTAQLEGHWKFRQQAQVHYMPSGEILESSRQVPPQTSYRSLDITDKELVYHHVRSNKSFPGDSTYTVRRSYTRRGNTLFVVPAPGIEAGPVLIKVLTDNQLTLSVVQERVQGVPYSDWELHFVR